MCASDFPNHMHELVDPLLSLPVSADFFVRGNSDSVPLEYRWCTIRIDLISPKVIGRLTCEETNPHRKCKSMALSQNLDKSFSFISGNMFLCFQGQKRVRTYVAADAVLDGQSERTSYCTPSTEES